MEYADRAHQLPDHVRSVKLFNHMKSHGILGSLWYGHDLPDDYFRKVGTPVDWRTLGTHKAMVNHVSILDRPMPKSFYEAAYKACLATEQQPDLKTCPGPSSSKA